MPTQNEVVDVVDYLISQLKAAVVPHPKVAIEEIRKNLGFLMYHAERIARDKPHMINNVRDLFNQLEFIEQEWRR